MRGMLSSARMRRRLAWTTAFVLLAGLVASLIVEFPSPGEPKEAKLSNVPGDVVKQDKARPFRSREGAVLTVARKFIATAVARRHVEDSWELVAPSLKQGFTRKRWAKGNIPVVPFQFREGRWRVGYSFENEIDLQVALFPDPKTKVRPVVFDLILNRFRRNGHDRWLVSSFVPAPAVGGDFGSRASRSGPPGFGNGQLVPSPTRSSNGWLLIPVGLFGLLLLVLAVLGIRGWRGARIYRAHVRERQISSSRPS